MTEENVGNEFVQSLSDQPEMPELGDTEEETSTDSQTETETDENTEDKKSSKSDDKEKNKGFHEHPAWKEREQKWEQRFAEQEKAANERISRLESQIAQRQEAHSELTENDIPDWFNGDLDTYKRYHAHQTKLMEEQATKIAEKIVTGKFKESQEATAKQEKAVQEATEYFKGEVARLESEHGEKIDQQELLKIAQENDLIDSKGRWNWSAAYRILSARPKDEEKTDTKEVNLKKNIAAITTARDSKSEGSKKKLATHEDLKDVW